MPASNDSKRRARIMIRVLKSSFLWQFVGGFALGAVGLLTLNPATDPVSGVPIEQIR